MTSKSFRIQHQTSIIHAFWCKIQDDAIHLINHILSELKSDLKLKINESLNHYGAASLIGDPNNFDDFYNKVVESEKRIRLENIVEAFPNSLILFNKRNKATFIIYINTSDDDMFYLHEKVRILIFLYDPDYYVVVSEAWAAPKINKNQQQVNYRRGDIAKLPSHEKTEILTFIGKFKNSITRLINPTYTRS